MKFLLSLALWIVLFQTQVFAGEAVFYGIRNQFNGTRAMGMGGAFTAVADDNTALFYNPAGLIQLEQGESNFFLKADIGNDTLSLYDDIDSAKGATGAGQSAQELTDLLSSKYGKQHSLRTPSVGWLWARPGWGMAIIPADLSIEMGMHRVVGPQINLVAINDTTFSTSFNFHIKKVNYGKLSMGVTAKAIYRMEVNKQVSVLDIENGDIFQPEDAREGLTVDADLGFLWISPWEQWNLKTAMVIRNIADYGYLAQFSAFGEESGEPDPLHRALDFGAAVEMPGFWVLKHRLAVDFRNVLHPNANLRKTLHVGYEMNGQLTSWLKGAFRVGLHQGYLSAGWTGEFAIFRLDLATYSDEVGVEGTPVENRRFMTTMSFDF